MRGSMWGVTEDLGIGGGGGWGVREGDFRVNVIVHQKDNCPMFDFVGTTGPDLIRDIVGVVRRTFLVLLLSFLKRETKL